MADTPPQPPGSPHDQDPNAIPLPPGMAPYEPPPVPQPPAAAPQFQPPQPAAPGQPPAGYPAAAPAAPYEPPVPGTPPPAPYASQTQPGYPQQYGGPGQPPPPPGWGAPAAPVKKSRRSLWITLAVIFGVLVLAIGSCTFWFVSTVKAPVDRSNEFLAAIDRGDYAQAISLSDPLCSQGMSAADLETTFRGADITYNLNNSSITNSNATVSGSFSVPGENVSTIEVYLRNNGGWSVCGFDAE